MDTQTVWLLAMSIATPVAGVVGFAIQLRQVKKTRLENEKLQLEVAALRQRAVEAERRIVLATSEEVQRITRGEVRFSRRRDEPGVFAKPKPKLKDRVILVAVVALVGLFLSYLIYDLYRIAAWFGARL